jgi:hypothetical protein
MRAFRWQLFPPQYHREARKKGGKCGQELKQLNSGQGQKGRQSMIVTFNIPGNIIEEAELIPGKLTFYLVDHVIAQGKVTEKHLWRVYHTIGEGYGQRQFSSFGDDSKEGQKLNEENARAWLQKQVECKAIYQSLYAKREALEKRMARLQNKKQAVNQQIFSLLTMG